MSLHSASVLPGAPARLRAAALSAEARAQMRGGLQAILFGCGDAAAWEAGGGAESDAHVLDVLETALLRFVSCTTSLALAAAAADAAAATASDAAAAAADAPPLPRPRVFITAASIVRGLASYGGDAGFGLLDAADAQRNYLSAAAAAAAASSARLRARLCLPFGGSHEAFSAAMAGKHATASTPSSTRAGLGAIDLVRQREERERFLNVAAPIGAELPQIGGGAATAAAAAAAAAPTTAVTSNTECAASSGAAAAAVSQQQAPEVEMVDANR